MDVLTARRTQREPARRRGGRRPTSSNAGRTGSCAWIALAACAALTTACTHEYQLVPFAASAAPLQKSRTKRVAVVLVEPLVLERYETSTDGHTFVFESAPAFFEQLFRSALANSVAQVQFFRAPAPAGFDAYVFPELSLEASGMMSHTCAARYGLSVKDGAGRIVAQRQLRTEETFVPIAAAGQACTTAVTSAFNTLTYPILSTLDQW